MGAGDGLRQKIQRIHGGKQIYEGPKYRAFAALSKHLWLN